MFGALLLLLLNSQLNAPAPTPAEGPQSFTFVQEPFTDEPVSAENPEKHLPDENATPRPDRSLTALFPLEPAEISSEEIFEENGGVAPGEAAPAEPNQVTPASASTLEAADKQQINIKFDEPDLDLEEGEDRFSDLYLEINEGKPEEDLREDAPSEPQDSLLIQTETSFDSVNEILQQIEPAPGKETLAEVDPVSTGLDVTAENQTPGSFLQEENSFFFHFPTQSEDPPPTEAAVEEDDPGKEASFASTEESPSTAAANSIYVAAKRSNQQHRRDFKAAVSSVRDESQAQVNRGAIIGAALITLISFILIGFVGIKISKKLR